MINFGTHYLLTVDIDQRLIATESSDRRDHRCSLKYFEQLRLYGARGLWQLRY